MAVVLLLPGIQQYSQLQVVADDLEQLHKLLSEDFGEDVARLLIQQFNPAVQHDMREEKSVDEALGEQDGTIDEAGIAAWRTMAYGSAKRTREPDAKSNVRSTNGRSRSSGSKIPTDDYPDWLPNACEKCGADFEDTDNFYDNREKINDGEYSSKSPHFKCKECEKAYWPPDSFGGAKKGRGRSRAS